MEFTLNKDNLNPKKIKCPALYGYLYYSCILIDQKDLFYSLQF